MHELRQLDLTTTDVLVGHEVVFHDFDHHDLRRVSAANFELLIPSWVLACILCDLGLVSLVLNLEHSVRVHGVKGVNISLESRFLHYDLEGAWQRPSHVVQTVYHFPTF